VTLGCSSKLRVLVSVRSFALYSRCKDRSTNKNYCSGERKMGIQPRPQRLTWVCYAPSRPPAFGNDVVVRGKVPVPKRVSWGWWYMRNRSCSSNVSRCGGFDNLLSISCKLLMPAFGPWSGRRTVGKAGAWARNERPGVLRAKRQCCRQHYGRPARLSRMPWDVMVFQHLVVLFIGRRIYHPT